MNFNEILNFIKNNSEVFNVLIPIFGFIFTAIGTIIGFVLKQNTQKKVNKKLEQDKLNYEIKIRDEEIEKLKNIIREFNSVVKSNDGEVLIHTSRDMPICPICWNKDKKTIPVYDDGSGNYECAVCHQKGIFDYKKHKELQKSFLQPIDSFYNDNDNNTKVEEFFNNL